MEPIKFRVFQLSSGNKFLYSSSSPRRLSFGYIISPEDEILSAHLDEEADRKLGQISAWSDEVESVDETFFPKVKFDWIGRRLNDNWVFARLKAAFEEKMVILDDHHCNGTGSMSETCSSRREYYQAAGMKNAYDDDAAFPLWAFILNHASVFGYDDFNYTFHGKDGSVASDKHNSRYTTHSFYAPAVYLRNLVQNYRPHHSFR